MSMSFDKPLNAEALAKIREVFGEPSVRDDKNLLFKHVEQIDRRTLTEIANIAKQPVTLGVHGPGEIFTMSDGTRYEATAQGWRKLP